MSVGLRVRHAHLRRYSQRFHLLTKQQAIGSDEQSVANARGSSDLVSPTHGFRKTQAPRSIQVEALAIPLALQRLLRVLRRRCILHVQFPTIRRAESSTPCVFANPNRLLLSVHRSRRRRSVSAAPRLLSLRFLEAFSTSLMLSVMRRGCTECFNFTERDPMARKATRLRFRVAAQAQAET